MLFSIDCRDDCDEVRVWIWEVVVSWNCCMVVRPVDWAMESARIWVVFSVVRVVSVERAVVKADRFESSVRSVGCTGWGCICGGGDAWRG